MKTHLLFVLAAALGASLPAFGHDQGETPEQERAERMAAGHKEGSFQHPLLSEEFPAKLKERLSLSPDQEGKVKAALEKSRPELEKAQADLKAAHERMKKAVATALEGIRATLDLEQKEKFDEMSRHLKGGGPGMMHGGSGMMRGGPGMRHGGPGKGCPGPECGGQGEGRGPGKGPDHDEGD